MRDGKEIVSSDLNYLRYEQFVDGQSLPSSPYDDELIFNHPSLPTSPTSFREELVDPMFSLPSRAGNRSNDHSVSIFCRNGKNNRSENTSSC